MVGKFLTMQWKVWKVNSRICPRKENNMLENKREKIVFKELVWSLQKLKFGHSF